MIDAGHGGIDGGASANDGTLEKDLNLDIALDLDSALRSRGIRTVLTRESDALLGKSDASSGKKMNDLKERVRIAQSAGECVFVSIHANKFSQSRYGGLQVFYSPDSEGGKTLAELIQSNVKRYLHPENERLPKESKNSIYILDKISSPAVLVECGFLSNGNDLALLKTDSYRKKLSFVICESVIEFLDHS